MYLSSLRLSEHRRHIAMGCCHVFCVGHHPLVAVMARHRQENLLQRRLRDAPVQNPQRVPVGLDGRVHHRQPHFRPRHLVVHDASHGVVEELRRRAEFGDHASARKRCFGALVLDVEAQAVPGPEAGLEVQARAQTEHVPRPHDADALAQHVGLLHGVRGEQDGVLALGLRDDLPQAVAAGGVEARGGFVHVHHFGLPHQRARRTEPALHAPAELA
mmetsp:Transcript_30173/g.50896  ORF Transcript_30173/g.50896 Transcript_30173/m.50896 type:complete len:216 (+) Transcript_30173:262-909(+)